MVSMYSQAGMVDTKRFRTIGHWKLRLGELELQMFPHTT